MIKRYLITFLSALLLSLTVSAQNADLSPTPYADFEAEYQAMLQSLNIVGVSVAVVKDNEIIYTRAFGSKDRSSGTPLDSDDIFRVASISKPVIATAIMQLVDAGELDLEQDVSDYLGFKLRNPRYPDVPITLEMIMSHTGSLNDSQGASNLNAANPDVNGRNAARCFNAYAPGEGFQYCNYNASLMAAIVERTAAMRWDQYILHNIFGLLDVDGAFSVDDLDKSRFATLYSWDGRSYQARPDAYKRPDRLDSYRPGKDVTCLSPAGGLKISAPGLTKFMLMLMNHGQSPLSEYRIISEESSRRMQTVLTDDVKHFIGEHQRAGLGLMRVNTIVPGVDLVGHIGIAYGVRAGMYFEPDKKFGFVVICNGTTTPLIVEKTIALLHRHFIRF